MRGAASVAAALLLATAQSAQAQRVVDRFEVERSPAFNADAALPEPSAGRPRSVMGGIAIGAVTGAAAAIPLTTYEVVTCADCWFIGLAIPVFATVGAVVGGIAGAAVHDGDGYPSSRRRASNGDPRDNRRSRSQDVGAGAALGTVAGIAATVALSYAFVNSWEDQDPTASADASGEALLIGFVAPVSTIIGAIVGARIDAAGGDLYDFFD